MRGFLAVAQREVVERRMWLVAAVVAGLIPLAAPLLPWVSAQSAAEARGALASLLAATLVTAGALALGVSMIGSELGERRLGFYFARPLSAAAIWWGKLAASFVVVVLVGAVIVLPSALLGGPLAVRELFDLPAEGASLASAVAVLVPLVLLVAHALSIAGRSRSSLLVVDLVAAIAFGAVIWFVGAQLRFTAPGLFLWLVAASIWTLLAGLVAAGWAQVAVGRIDARRGHRALSATLWGTLGSFALILAAYAGWVVSATPSSIGHLWDVRSAPGGSWTVVSGSSSGRGDYVPIFLLDTGSGRWIRVGLPGRWRFGPMYSDDGRIAVWQEPAGRSSRDPRQVVFADLAADQPLAVATSLMLGEDVQAMQLSPSGRRLAVVADKTVSIYSLPDGGLVRAVATNLESAHVVLRFLGEEQVSLSVWPAAERNQSGSVNVTIWRLDVPSARLVETGKLTAAPGFWAMPGDPQGELLLAFHSGVGGRELVLHDARTGVPRASLLSGTQQRPVRVAFLHDGRILVGESRAGVGHKARISVHDREGRLLRTIDVGEGYLGRLGSEVSPGVLVVTVSPHEDWYWPGREDARALLVDVERGNLQKLAEGYVPARSTWWWSPQQQPVEPGSACARLFRSPEGALVRYEPTTGGFTTILASRWPF